MQVVCFRNVGLLQIFLEMWEFFPYEKNLWNLRLWLICFSFHLIVEYGKKTFHLWFFSLSLSFQQGYAKIPAGPASVKILPIQYSSVTSVYYTIKILVCLGSIYLSIHPFTILMQLKTVQPNILRPISFHAKSYSPNYCT